MTTSPSDFIHLHVHTQYSLLDGAIRIESLLERAKEFGMGAATITDHGTMFGTVDFYQQAVKAGVKPIIGCECYVAPRTLSDKTTLDKKGLSHLILLAQNQEGYRNLCKLTSIAQLKGFYYKPRVDKELLRECSEGLIALSACLQGEVPKLIRADRLEDADQVALEYARIFGEGNFFLEVQNNGIDLQTKVNQALLEMSSRLSLPLVATNDCHYLNSGDVKAHDVLLCIQTGKTVQDDDRLKFRTDQLYFKSGEEMCADFSSYPGALENTTAIAARCNVEFQFDTFHFPKFDIEEERPVDDLFEDEVRAGFVQRMEVLKAQQPDLVGKTYDERLEMEISIIKQMGFCGYFLIVSDFIRYAKRNNIPVGPGRGSAAGSLVAYALEITNLDPISYGLIFERFLNPARKSMPDIDVDFCINGREEVFKYVVDRYGGGDYVAQIITYGKMKTRAVIRDVGRALDIPLREVDAIAKMVPDVLNIKLDAALKQEPRLAAMADEKPEIGNLIDICRVLEGLPRHASTHAAGVVIADKPLMEYLPLYRGKKGEVVTQFDMKGVEKIGLVKFDFLGLRNLTVIENTLKLITKQGRTPPDIDHLDLDDSATYQLLQSGDTTGVFQLESSGMKDLLVRLKPERFDDVIALVALYRPGPLESGMVDDFVERRHGRKDVEYMVPELEPILNNTYGVIVYQEQVMKIAGSLANYSMAEADDLRKAMGKKIFEILAQHRERFVQGAVGRKIPGDKAGKLFDLIEKFGGYGFNKSHSAAYALIAYQTAYLKAHYPEELLAALLTSEMHSSDGVVKYIAECRSHDIEVLPPDVNESDKQFTVDNGKIRFGLAAVKNVGEGAVDAVVAARQEGKFSTVFDFCERVDLQKANKRVLEGLIKCGAFDATGEPRARLAAALEDVMEYGQCVQKEKVDPQMGLFDMGGSCATVTNHPALPNLGEWDEKQRLMFEKESLGFFISGHPLEPHGSILEKFTNTDTLRIKEQADGKDVRIGGVIQHVKTIQSKNGLMAFVTLEDMNGSVELTVFSRLYGSAESMLVVDEMILVRGDLQKDENSAKILAQEIISLDSAEEKWSASVHLIVDLVRTREAELIQLRDLLSGYPGECKTFLHLRDPGAGAETVISLAEAFKVRAGSELRREVNGLLGYPAVETFCGQFRKRDDGKRSNRRYRRNGRG
jgi:DNA polymerase III subunit alpha